MGANGNFRASQLAKYASASLQVSGLKITLLPISQVGK
jgi:hypothetical protein